MNSYQLQITELNTNEIQLNTIETTKIIGGSRGISGFSEFLDFIELLGYSRNSLSSIKYYDIDD